MAEALFGVLLITLPIILLVGLIGAILFGDSNSK